MPTLALLLLRTDAGRCALRVEEAAGVRPHAALEALPGALPSVAGVLRDGGQVLPVLAPFGPDGTHLVIVAPPGAGRFALLVEEVEGVVRIAEDELAGPPAGQGLDLVCGVAGGDARGAFLLDAAALARALHPTRGAP